MPASSEDDSLFRVLEALPREGPPEFSVELLLRKLLWRRVRFGLLGAAVAAPLLALLLFRAEPEPPVNLKLKLVEIDTPLDLPSRDPPELNLP